MQNAPVFSATRIAELLTEPGATPLTPTHEQRAVIEHELEGTALVIAGAGSGKTETMANRVVWLVANGAIDPDRILGLTFTRKAAGELRERISGRLHTFVERLVDNAEQGLLTEPERLRAAELVTLLEDGLDLPEVSTYNAFASGVLQEFGAAAGIAPGATVIDEATAWRVAREVILASHDRELLTTDMRTPELIRHTMAIDHAVADNLTSFERTRQIITEFSRVLDLPYNEKDTVGGPDCKNYAPVRDAVANVADTPLLARLAEAFAEEKQRRGLIEFSDQLALASRTLEFVPEAGAVLRRRYGVVLLDEVQDTSVGQTRLLSRIFSGVPVMAVGDPHQSIYGWRGASAEGLQSFHADFAARGTGKSQSAATLTLSTSWRNPVTVLDAANVIAAPLAAASEIDVPKLAPRPGAKDGVVDWRFPETLHEEQDALAAWMAAERAAHIREKNELPTAAVVFRNRRHMAPFSAALTAAGVPNIIVGLGGLLSTPEITDVVSTLRCVWYADAGGDLIRLLAGPRFRLGVADIAGLKDAARWFARRDETQQEFSPEDIAADSVLPDPDRDFTLIDALDQIAAIRDPMRGGRKHASLKTISDVGVERLREAGWMLANLRQRVGGDVIELIQATVNALRLDIELEAHEGRDHAGGAAALANLDVFIDLVEGHLAVDSRGTLASLLEWIERAVEADEIEEHVSAPAPGTVQLITAHGSKGLEWDLVAIPRMVDGEFPSTPRRGVGWLRKGQLPDELRGDAAARPQLNWRIATNQKELKERIAEYVTESKGRFAEEERRLGYVAITRAAQKLLLTGSFWGGQSRARVPSLFMLELQEHGVITGLPESSEHEEDPSEAQELTMQWPLDPLGRRADVVLAAAATLSARIAEEPDEADLDIDSTVRLLLAERAAQGDDAAVVKTLPGRITASTFHEFVEDPEAAERSRLRPIPQRPFRRTRIGNRFHEWVERRATTAHGTSLALFDLEPDTEIDAAAEGFDAFVEEAELQPLIESFEASRWADLQPISVEQQVALPFAGRTLVCKLDAVYELPPREGEEAPRFEVIDWKAGRSPQTAKERETRFFQLDLYRHAYAQWAGVSPERIDVSLFYVAEGVELRGDQVRTLPELEEIWLAAAERVSDPQTAERSETAEEDRRLR
ncbi:MULTISPECIES: ATP-dependent DNA helicase [unclassified Leucobacter]|uniref:ATP-dependent DNA helicase n=1 Tax=unclassified Leucobacter TaxID=2621730 RepID=UPI00203AAF04|nr:MULTISPECIES: ATP-dependent DNA helicase [unclassified Leucobacter]